MSEPMTSGDIEDVLSSIRRLVSEDLRPAPRQAAPAQPPAAHSAAAPRDGGDKLLLTAALRVVGDDPAPAFQSIRSGGDTALAVSAVAAAMGPDAVQDEDGDAARLPAHAANSDSDHGEAPFVDLTDGADPQDGGFAPVDPEEAWPALNDPPPRAPAGAEDWAPEADLDDADLDDSGDDAADWAAAAPGAAQPAPTWADAAEAEVLRELSDQGDADPVFGRMGASDEPLYDEDLLRELVRDIIREELQGALGERITRNVRKLVRAEIARALAVRDFE